ncbi:hypothetical protein ZOD2009_09810 [Haladaptatus paucihalophilus DX253]|uniref:Uncharacterized protein n=1 Tax=Haladaptatus paucihalophilus DX253 TaxID=797209 RepID=E7QT62_HALPU|nr:hypothetical protein ZOD2009_09810 [Haladaptatus paucihalophilus DX253]
MITPLLSEFINGFALEGITDCFAKPLKWVLVNWNEFDSILIFDDMESFAISCSEVLREV